MLKRTEITIQFLRDTFRTLREKTGYRELNLAEGEWEKMKRDGWVTIKARIDEYEKNKVR